MNSFMLGMALLTLLASWTSSWFTLQFTASLAMFIQLGLWFVLPESPRWLIVTSRTKEAELLIRKAAERNGKQLTDKSLGFDIELKPKDSVPNAPVDQKAAFKELFNPHLLKTTIVLFISWPIVTLGYYGITFGMASLSDDLFMDFAMSSLIEIPSYVLVLLLMDIIGRKPIFSGSLLLTGISCIIVGTMDKNGDYANFRRVLAMTGKFFASGTLAIVYVYTAELYPTAIRSTAIGSCSFMAKVGGIISPYVGLYLPAVTMPSIPFYLMGGIAIFGGFLSLLLPESLGSSLPETMEDVDEMKKNGKPFWKCMNPCSGRSQSHIARSYRKLSRSCHPDNDC